MRPPLTLERKSVPDIPVILEALSGRRVRRGVVPGTGSGGSDRGGPQNDDGGQNAR
jgi:hypothetical protein